MIDNEQRIAKETKVRLVTSSASNMYTDTSVQVPGSAGNERTGKIERIEHSHATRQASDFFMLVFRSCFQFPAGRCYYFLFKNKLKKIYILILIYQNHLRY